MSQVLVINERLYESVRSEKKNKETELSNREVINEHGFSDADDFFRNIIKQLNENYDFFNITSFRFFTSEENKKYSMYSSFVDNFIDEEFDRVIIGFTPIQSKLGNTIISQELMPIVNTELESDLTFLLNKKIKKILLLTSQVNVDNKIKDDSINTLQLNINILNTLGFDVIPIFHVVGLSPDSNFSSFEEYLSLLNDLRISRESNDQTEYIYLKDGVIYGACEERHIKGQFSKFLTFRFYPAIMLGGNEFKYDVTEITKHKKNDNHFTVLEKVVEYANNNDWESYDITLDDTIEDTNPVEEKDYLDINKTPEMQSGKIGKKRFKTKRAIREKAIYEGNYLCDCHDDKHFYFESSQSLENYVEGHHLIPMNRQELYWKDYKINLDVVFNIVPLCPNCHTQVHNGSRGAKLQILSELFVRNEKNIKVVDKTITLSKLVSFYNISISKEEESYYLKYGEKTLKNKLDDKNSSVS